jgi:hypothetical protein
MPSPDFSQRVESLVLTLAWSQWAEFGLSGWERHHRETALDIEALILATPTIAVMDARLLEESLDWCVTNGRRFVSGSRLRNLVGAAGPEVAAAFGPFAATVNQHAHTNWFGATRPMTWRRTGRSAAPDLERPALIQARLRAAFGVSARAEVLKLLLSEPYKFMTIAELSLRTAYGKDNVADSVEMLRAAGVVETASEANRQHVRLGDPSPLLALVGTAPREFFDWAPILRLVLVFLRFAESAPSDPIPRAADIASLLREIQADIPRTVGVVPLRASTGEGYVADFEAWVIRILEAWAGTAGSRAVAQTR